MITTCLLVCFTVLQAQRSDFQEVDFSKADSIVGLYENHDLNDLPLLSAKLTNGLDSEVEKFRAIYKWVAVNIENDFNLYARNKRIREKWQGQPEKLKEWNRKFNPVAFKVLLEKHKTICTGYAYLIKELAYYANLEAEVIDGYGRSSGANIGGDGIPNHSWNAVELNGKWYLCDATWSSGALIAGTHSVLSEFSEAYFLTEPKVFIQNHYPLDLKWTLLENPPTLTTFLNAPLVYKQGVLVDFQTVSPNDLHIKVQRNELITFSFLGAVDHLEIQVTANGTVLETIKKDLVEKKSKGHYFTHAFTSRGSYDFHILNNEKYVATYAVIVGK